MTSRERVIAMINRKPVDRIPVITGSAMVVEYIQKVEGYGLNTTEMLK